MLPRIRPRSWSETLFSVPFDPNCFLSEKCSYDYPLVNCPCVKKKSLWLFFSVDGAPLRCDNRRRILRDSITCEYIRQPRMRFAPSRSLMYSYELQKIPWRTVHALRKWSGGPFLAWRFRAKLGIDLGNRGHQNIKIPPQSGGILCSDYLLENCKAL